LKSKRQYLSATSCASFTYNVGLERAAAIALLEFKLAKILINMFSSAVQFAKSKSTSNKTRKKQDCSWNVSWV